MREAGHCPITDVRYRLWRLPSGVRRALLGVCHFTGSDFIGLANQRLESMVGGEWRWIRLSNV